jgi:hypothetical protein
VADSETVNNDNFDGGTSSQIGDINLIGGNSEFAISPSGSTAGFNVKYTNIAETTPALEIIEATFQRFNDPNEVEFIKESFEVIYQEKTLDKLDVIDFFHPLQSFSNYQKQTFVILPQTSANLDPSSFTSTNGEVSMLIAKAEYLPGTSIEEKVLFWDYKGNQRNIMGEIMILTGAIKEDLSWRGWDVDPFSTYGHTGPANSANGGFIFTNPTDSEVQLTVITAN